MTETDVYQGTIEGVPYLAKPPARANEPAPVVFAWHLMDAPRTEAAFEAALPLSGIDAWRIYLGLPMCGARTPSGGFDEIMQLGMEDAVTNLYGPITKRAVAEFAPVKEALRDKFGFADGPIGVMGGSLGAAVAALVTADQVATVGAAVLVSPLLQVRAVVAAMQRVYGITYEWTAHSGEIGNTLDFVARAGDFVAAGCPPIRIVVGAEDDAEGFIEPAENFAAAIAARYGGEPTVDLHRVERMGHALAEEPGLDPAPQLPHAARADALAAEWFARHLRHAVS